MTPKTFFTYQHLVPVLNDQNEHHFFVSKPDVVEVEGNSVTTAALAFRIPNMVPVKKENHQGRKSEPTFVQEGFKDNEFDAFALAKIEGIAGRDMTDYLMHGLTYRYLSLVVENLSTGLVLTYKLLCNRDSWRVRIVGHPGIGNQTSHLVINDFLQLRDSDEKLKIQADIDIIVNTYIGLIALQLKSPDITVADGYRIALMGLAFHPRSYNVNRPDEADLQNHPSEFFTGS